MIKKSGKVDKSKTYNVFSTDISFLFKEESSSDLTHCNYLIYPLFYFFIIMLYSPTSTISPYSIYI